MSDVRRKGLAIGRLNPRSAFQLAALSPGKSAESALRGLGLRDAPSAAGLEPGEATTGGPRVRVAEVAARAESAGHIRRFEALLERENVLRSCELSLKYRAAAIQTSPLVKISALWPREKGGFFSRPQDYAKNDVAQGPRKPPTPHWNENSKDLERRGGPGAVHRIR